MPQSTLAQGPQVMGRGIESQSPRYFSLLHTPPPALKKAPLQGPGLLAGGEPLLCSLRSVEVQRELSVLGSPPAAAELVVQHEQAQQWALQESAVFKH